MTDHERTRPQRQPPRVVGRNGRGRRRRLSGGGAYLNFVQQAAAATAAAKAPRSNLAILTNITVSAAPARPAKSA